MSERSVLFLGTPYNRMYAFRFINTSFDSSPQLNVRAGAEELGNPQLDVDAGLEEPVGDGRCDSSYVCWQLDRDVHAIAEDDGKIANIHANAEKFDPRAEGDSIVTANIK